METVLLTGATGTVGSAVCDALLQDGGFQVTVAVRRPVPSRPRLDQKRVDLSQRDFCRLLGAQQYDHIIDCSQPRYSEREVGPPGSFELNVVENLERLASGRTRRLIYTGGVWIYGTQPFGRLIDEDSTLNPVRLGEYRRKVLERIYQGHAGWMQICLPSIVYGAVGPLQEIKAGIGTGSARAISDRKVVWSVVERTDLARAYLELLQQEYDERLFMIAEEAPVPIADFYECVADAMGYAFSGEAGESLRRNMSDDEWEIATCSQPVDSSLIRRTLGWRNVFNFTESCRQFVTPAERQHGGG